MFGDAFASPPPTPSEPVPTTAPTTAPTTTIEPTVPAESTIAPTTQAPTTQAPTTLPSTTTQVPEPAAPAVVYAANAECNPAIGQTTVSWRVTNNGETPVTIIDNTEDAPLEPSTVPPLGEATATHVIEGPATDQQVTSTVTIDVGDGVVIEKSDDITAAACEGPEPPPEVSFTFTVTPSVTRAAVGDTVNYTYCGQNLSDIDLEVVRLVDDRLGVVIELPSVETIVGPGETLCSTDLGVDVSYVVPSDDAGSVVRDNAVVTVRTTESTPREFQQTAFSEVVVSRLAAGPTAVSEPTTTLVPREALVLSAVAECAQATGVTTVTWTVANNTATPVGGTDLRYVFGVSGVEIAANSSRTGSETFVGPAAATSIDNEFYGATVIEGATVPFYAYGALNVPACVASQSDDHGGAGVVDGAAVDDAAT